MASGADGVTTVRATGAGPTPRRRTLLVLRGVEIAAHALPLTGVVTVGRGSTCEIQVDDPSLSRHHVRIELAEGRIAVTDLDSTNGTLVGGVRTSPGQPVEISADEPIVVGDVELVVQESRTGRGPAAGLTIGAPAPPLPSGSLPPRDQGPLVADPAMRRLYDLAARLARGGISILLTGETGAGKEVLAEFIHRSSPRASAPLVRVNCAALADSLVEAELFGHERGAFTGALRERRGLLESADGGTVLLDEIGEMSPAVQAKILRVLEARQVMRVGASTPRPIDVRFLAATNRDLEAEVATGGFRRDLFFRLAGAVLVIPPLRERPQEIAGLATAFAAEAAHRVGRSPPRLAEATLSALRARSWPGNARELRNVIERLVLLTESAVIDPTLLALADPTGVAAPTVDGPTAPIAMPTAPAPATTDLRDHLAAVERERILAALERNGGNQSRAAAELGMPRRTLITRLEAYGVPRPRRKP